MSYTRSIPFCGNADKAFDYAAVVLSSNGFRIVDKQDKRLELSGPGLFSSRQDPLRGATQIRLSAEGGTLQLDASLGAVRRLRRFLIALPLSMAIGFALLFGPIMGLIFGRTFGVGFGVPFAPGWLWLAVAVPLSLLPTAPWLVLWPLLGRVIRNRTTRALDTLLSNIVAMARED